MKQRLTGEIDDSTIIVGIFNTPLSAIDLTIRQKITRFSFLSNFHGKSFLFHIDIL